MPKTNNNFMMANWIANFNNRNPTPQIPPDPCAHHCTCNTASTVECKCNIEDTLQLQFSNHAWLTILTINLFFPNVSVDQLTASKTALGLTPLKITDAIRPFTDASNCPPIFDALSMHIALAGPFLNAVKTGVDVEAKQAAFYDQATQLASAFSALNPCILTYEMMLSMWQFHNQCVIDIANSINSNDYNQGMVYSQQYFYENYEMSNEIAHGIAELYCCQGC